MNVFVCISHAFNTKVVKVVETEAQAMQWCKGKPYNSYEKHVIQLPIVPYGTNIDVSHW